MAWLASNRVTNPLIDQVILDTGPLPAGAYWFTAQGSGSVAAAMEVQHRDATNATTIKSQIIANPAFGTSPPFEIPERFQFNINANERFRIVMVAAVSGAVSASLIGNF